jgi:hypothetical protein
VEKDEEIQSFAKYVVFIVLLCFNIHPVKFPLCGTPCGGFNRAGKIKKLNEHKQYTFVGKLF